MSSNLTEQEKSVLFKLARATVEGITNRTGKPALPKADGHLAEKRGAFVTIHKRGRLRGCIGMMIGERPLLETIQEMAIAAATQDPRFQPLAQSELAEIDIEISVLSPMEKVSTLDEIETGRDGILISQGFNQGVFLPQVATEQGWDREQFLSRCCEKAGLPADAYRDPKTTIEKFTADVFGEKDGKR